MNLHTLDGDFDNIQAIIDPAILLLMPVLSFIFVIVQCMWSFWVGANLCRFCIVCFLCMYCRWRSSFQEDRIGIQFSHL